MNYKNKYYKYKLKYLLAKKKTLGGGDYDSDDSVSSPEFVQGTPDRVYDNIRALAAMSPEERTATLAAMSPEERAATLTAMSPEERAAAVAAMLPEEGAAAEAQATPRREGDPNVLFVPETPEDEMPDDPQSPEHLLSLNPESQFPNTAERPPPPNKKK